MRSTPSPTRRALLAAAAAPLLPAGLVLGAAAARAQEGRSLRWANLVPGFTTLVTDYMAAKRIDAAHGLALGKPTSYTSVTTYYNDFVAGNYDVCIGSWDTFASRQLAGVPLQFVCTITTGNMINIVVPPGGVDSIGALEGKTLAAPQSTGTYRMMRAVVKSLEGIDLEQIAKVQNVDNPAASVTLVMANRADAGLSWEPNISVGLARVPDMRVLYNAGAEYRKKTGVDLPYFGVAVRKEALARDRGLVERIDKAFGACIAGITGNVDEAVSLAGSRASVSPEVLKSAIGSGRLEFKHLSMGSEAGRRSIAVATDVLVGAGLLPRKVDDSFYAA